MKIVFADSFYYFALLSKDDGLHARAVDFSRTFRGRVVTTDWVLTEIADGLAAPNKRHGFVALREKLQQDENVLIVPATTDLFERGCIHYQRRADKDWPLTDCISFLVMQEHGITEALTGDHHFEQAGFVALLK